MKAVSKRIGDGQRSADTGDHTPLHLDRQRVRSAYHFWESTMSNSAARSAACSPTAVTNTSTSVTSTVRTDGAVATLFDDLVRANLSGAAYRVVLDTMARLLRHGIQTEAVPVDWMASRLGISRNTIGAAYRSAEEAGLLRRLSVAARGAPTRTSLNGPMLRLAQLLSDPARVTAVAGNRFLRRRPGAEFHQASAATRRRGNRSDPARVTIHDHYADSREHANGDIRQSTAAYDDTCADVSFARDTSHVIRGSDAQLETNDPSRVTADGNAPSDEPASVAGQPSYLGPINGERGIPTRVAEHDRGDTPPERPTNADPARVILSPAELMAAIGRLPAEARLAASQATDTRALTIDPTWGLSIADVDLLRRLVPPKENPRAKTPARPAPGPGIIANSSVATTLWLYMVELETVVGKGKAPATADEIAYQVMVKGLGKGDLVGGVRAGLSLVRARRWKTPRGFSAEWLGAVERALRATTNSASDAQETVH